ncbi:MAG TPA: hypothetical protein VF263_11715, partial [Longimicrobiaceae bacterium]
VLGASAVAGACAAGATGGAAAGPSGAASGLPTVECPTGVSTAPGAQGVIAQRQLLLRRYPDAVTAAQAGLAADSANPQLLFILGQAQIGVGRFAAADSAWDRVVALCPAFEAEVTPLRREAGNQAYSTGNEKLSANDTASAMAGWAQAVSLNNQIPEAHYNMGVVHANRSEFTQAAERYRQALDIVNALPADTSATVTSERADLRQSIIAGLSNVAARQLEKEQFAPATELFRYLTSLDRNDRFSWFNYMVGLYRQQRWDDLVPVAQRVIAIEPLNQDAGIILFNAYKGQMQAAEAARNTARRAEMEKITIATLEQVDSLPVYVEDLRLDGAGSGQAALTGRVMGNRARPGTQMTLTFTFYGPSGPVGTPQSATVAAPAKSGSVAFRVPFPAGATSFSYTYR